MSESTLTSRGRITIPKVVRERLRLRAGDKVYFDLRDDGSVLLMARNEPLEGLFGALRSRAGAQALTIGEMNPATLGECEVRDRTRHEFTRPLRPAGR